MNKTVLEASSWIFIP